MNQTLFHVLDKQYEYQNYINLFLLSFFPIVFSTFFKRNFVFICIFGLSFIPLFFLAIDWGRWIHIIFILIFCYHSLSIPKEIKKLDFNRIFIFLISIFLFFQIFFTRIPHCCNIVEKNINLIGGFGTKIIVLNKLIFNKIDVEKRFKKF